jgi:NAD(P)H-hydrate epimerase
MSASIDRFPTLSGLPTLTADQMREVDRIMIDDLHIELVQMMENAGRNLADLAIALYAPGTAVVLAGGGGNGGGGLVAARHLANRGVTVTVILATERARLSPVPTHQLDILERMGIAVVADPLDADLVIDALVGYSLQGNPRGRAAELIAWANRQPAPVLSLDTPSGLDVTSGSVGEPCVKASATMTLALPKTGLTLAKALVGELYLADISVPAVVYRRVGVGVPDLFRISAVVRVID